MTALRFKNKSLYMLSWRPITARQWPGKSNTQADAQTSKRGGKMGVTDSSDVQNIKQQQKMNKTGTLMMKCKV